MSMLPRVHLGLIPDASSPQNSSESFIEPIEDTQIAQSERLWLAVKAGSTGFREGDQLFGTTQEIAPPIASNEAVSRPEKVLRVIDIKFYLDVRLLESSALDRATARQAQLLW